MAKENKLIILTEEEFRELRQKDKLNIINVTGYAELNNGRIPLSEKGVITHCGRIIIIENGKRKR